MFLIPNYCSLRGKKEIIKNSETRLRICVLQLGLSCFVLMCRLENVKELNIHLERLQCEDFNWLGFVNEIKPAEKQTISQIKNPKPLFSRIYITAKLLDFVTIDFKMSLWRNKGMVNVLHAVLLTPATALLRMGGRFKALALKYHYFCPETAAVFHEFQPVIWKKSLCLG